MTLTIVINPERSKVRNMVSGQARSVDESSPSWYAWTSTANTVVSLSGPLMEYQKTRLTHVDSIFAPTIASDVLKCAKCDMVNIEVEH